MTRSASLAKDNHLRWNLFGIRNNFTNCLFFFFFISIHFCTIVVASSCIFTYCCRLLAGRRRSKFEIVVYGCDSEKKTFLTLESFSKAENRNSVPSLLRKSPFGNLDVSEIELVKHRSRVNAFFSHY